MSTTQIPEGFSAAVADSAAFRLWLESRDRKEVIGTGACSWFCPISRFIQAWLRVKTREGWSVGVGVTGITVIRGGGKGTFRFDLPDWMHDFIWRVDSDCIGHLSVRAERALKILDEIEKRTLLTVPVKDFHPLYEAA